MTTYNCLVNLNGHEQLGGKTPQAGAWMTGPEIKKAMDAYNTAMGFTQKVPVPPPMKSKPTPTPNPKAKRGGFEVGQKAPPPHLGPKYAPAPDAAAINQADDLRPVPEAPTSTDEAVPFPIGVNEEIPPDEA